MDLKTMEKYITTGWDRYLYTDRLFDEELAKRIATSFDNCSMEVRKVAYKKPFEIKKVVFNPPCTIILWTDGTKTIVRTQDGEPFDPEKGMTMAFMKKVRGNTGKYCDEINKWVKPWEAKQPKVEEPELSTFDMAKKLKETTQMTKEAIDSVKSKVDRLKELMNELGKSEANE